MTMHIVLWKEPRVHSYFLATSPFGHGSMVSVETISGDTPEPPRKQWSLDTPVEVSISVVRDTLRRLRENQDFREIE